MTTATIVPPEPTTARPACPSWCTLEPYHHWDSWHGGDLWSRGHAGPEFGDYISTNSTEFENALGEHHYDICVDPAVETDVSTAAHALQLARCLQDAAAWVEARA